MITQGGPHSDVGWGVTTDSSGSVYFVGSTTVPGPLSSVFVTKVDPENGRIVWNVTYSGGGSDAAYQALWNGGTLYVGGRSTNTTDDTLDMLVQAYNASSGRLIWTTTWEGSQGSGYNEIDGIALDGNDLYAVGWAAVSGHSEDIGLLKIDATTGRQLWSRTWGTSGWEEANGDIVINSSRIYVAGRYDSPNPLYGGKAMLAAFEKSDGSYVKNVTWWEGSGESDFLGMTGDSHYLYPVGISATTGDRIVLQKYDHNLTLIWTATWEGPKSESSRMDRVTPDGMEIIVSGQTMSYGNGGNDALMLGYDLSGNLLWSTIWGGTGNDEPQGLALQGGYAYVSGQTTSYGAGSQDAFLAKFALPNSIASSSSTASITSTTTRQSSSSSTSQPAGGGGIPEFPFLITSTAAFTILIIATYAFVRSRSKTGFA